MKFSFFTIQLTLLLLIFPFDSQACRCGHPSFEESYEKADVIFIGKVIGYRSVYSWWAYPYIDIDSNYNVIETSDSIYSKRWSYVYEVDVIRRIKNLEIFDKIEIISYDILSSCRFTLDLGKEYVIYGDKIESSLHSFEENSDLPLVILPGNHFSTSLCSRTTSFVEREIKIIEGHWNRR